MTDQELIEALRAMAPDTIGQAAACRIECLLEWQRQMVEIQASGGRLDGYRELADKLAARDAEIDRLRAAVTGMQKWRNYYRAKWYGPLACPQPDEPENPGTR